MTLLEPGQHVAQPLSNKLSKFGCLARLGRIGRLDKVEGHLLQPSSNYVDVAIPASTSTIRSEMVRASGELEPSTLTMRCSKVVSRLLLIPKVGFGFIAPHCRNMATG